jgi:Skp family chaperone for outer membrane proteins
VKKLILIATGFVCLAGGSYFLANTWGAPQAPAEEVPHRVGLIDIGVVFEKYEKLKHLSEELNAEVKEAQDKYIAKQKRGQALQEEMKVYNEGSEEYQSRENKLVKLAAELDTEKKMLGNEFQKKKAKMLHQVYLEIHDAVEKFCDEYKFTVVIKFSRVDLNANDAARINQLMSQPVMYNRKRDDLTDGVVKYLNRNYLEAAGGGNQAAAPKAAGGGNQAAPPKKDRKVTPAGAKD